VIYLSGKQVYEKLIKTSAKIINRKGYQGASINDIALEMNFQKSNLYYYVESKQELLQKIILEGIKIYLKELEKISSINQNDFEKKLKDLIFSHLKPLNKEIDITSVFLKEMQNVEEDEGTTHIKKLIKKYHSYWNETLRLGVEEGKVRPNINYKLTTYLIIGMCNSIYGWYKDYGLLSLEEISDNIYEIIKKGLS
jgi:TetR/AcrR family transcriptional regulator, cholesterol catabolism regulator